MAKLVIEVDVDEVSHLDGALEFATNGIVAFMESIGGALDLQKVVAHKRGFIEEKNVGLIFEGASELEGPIALRVGYSLSPFDTRNWGAEYGERKNFRRMEYDPQTKTLTDHSDAVDAVGAPAIHD